MKKVILVKEATKETKEKADQLLQMFLNISSKGIQEPLPEDASHLGKQR